MGVARERNGAALRGRHAGTPRRGRWEVRSDERRNPDRRGTAERTGRRGTDQRVAAARPRPGPQRLVPRPPTAPQAPVVPASDPRRFGRVAEDGTVYLVTPAGERVIGSMAGR